MILDGKVMAIHEKEKMKEELASLNFQPGLAVVLVGDDPASQIYVSSKEKACQEMGLLSKVVRVPESTTQDELYHLIASLNLDDSIDGILVQSPPPPHIDESLVIEAINPRKDVDCFHPFNFGRLFAGNQLVEPCTPKGIMLMLDYYGIELKGKHAVVIGRSNIVGKPTAQLLMQRHATVTMAHSRTVDLPSLTRQADILVAAVGKPHFVTADMVKNGAVVIDVGINRVPDSSKPKGYRVVGDVDYEAVKSKASAITPVPGGVGALTVIMLLRNTIELAKLRRAQ